MIKEHVRQTDFLQSLMVGCEGELARQLARRLTEARREDRVMRIAVLLSVMLGLVALGALGYAAVLAPDSFFRDSLPLRMIQTLGMASFICAIAFLVHWYWKRAEFNGLHEECRCFIKQQLQSTPAVGSIVAFAPRAPNGVHVVTDTLTP